MKRLAIIGFLVVVLTMTLAAPAMAAAPTLHKATGGGTSDLTAINPDVTRMTVTFTAIQTDDSGNAKGQAQFNFRGFPSDDFSAVIHCSVLYLVVDTATNKAWIGGVITETNFEPYAVGQEWVWEVQDNGEGKGVIDVWSDAYIGFPASYALTQPDLLGNFAFPVKGNIQVS